MYGIARNVYFRFHTSSKTMRFPESGKYTFYIRIRRHNKHFSDNAFVEFIFNFKIRYAPSNKLKLDYYVVC